MSDHEELGGETDPFTAMKMKIREHTRWITKADENDIAKRVSKMEVRMTKVEERQNMMLKVFWILAGAILTALAATGWNLLTKGA